MATGGTDNKNPQPPTVKPIKQKEHIEKISNGTNQAHETSVTNDIEDDTEEMTVTINVDPDTADPNTAWRRLGKGQRIKEVKPKKWTSPVPKGCVRFVCMSDTHSRVERRNNFYVPDGDILLFAGDMTMSGTCEEIVAFNDFIGKLPYRHKIVIAGNHDFQLDDESEPFFTREFKKARLKKYGVQEASRLLTKCTFIQDQLIDIAGIKIYGSPWVPVFGSHAFSMYRGQDLLDKWNKIPESTDILITHAPPLGIGDNVPGNIHAGCVELLNTVQQRVRPQYHVFGHIHEGYGLYSDGTTTFINASICAKGYKPTNMPIIFDVNIPKGHSKLEALKHCGDYRSDTSGSDTDSFDSSDNELEHDKLRKFQPVVDKKQA